MPLHCAATRPKFLNIPSFSSPNPVTCWLEILENRTYVTMFNDFLFSSVSSLALWCRLVWIVVPLATAKLPCSTSEFTSSVYLCPLVAVYSKPKLSRCNPIPGSWPENEFQNTIIMVPEYFFQERWNKLPESADNVLLFIYFWPLVLGIRASSAVSVRDKDQGYFATSMRS